MGAVSAALLDYKRLVAQRRAHRPSAAPTIARAMVGRRSDRFDTDLRLADGPHQRPHRYNPRAQANAAASERIYRRCPANAAEAFPATLTAWPTSGWRVNREQSGLNAARHNVLPAHVNRIRIADETGPWEAPATSISGMHPARKQRTA
jgi:hypothetical protein